MKLGVSSGDSAPLPVIAATRARGRTRGSARPIGRRLLVVVGVLVVALGIGYAIFLRATRILPPLIAADVRARAELPLEARGPRAYVGSSWMSRERGIWEIHLEGEPYQMGWAHGRLGQQMHQVQEEFLFGEFEKYVPSALARFGIKNLVRFGYRKLGDDIPLSRREELAGEAAAGTDFHADFLPIYHRLVYYHSLHDITQSLEHSPLLGCSAFAASGSATVGSKLIIGRNFDFEGPEPFDRDKAVIFFREKGRIPLASVAWAGMSGVVTGVNAEHIFVSLNAARTDDKGHGGMPVEILMREILGQAKSIDDVFRLVRDTEVMVPDFYLVADGKTGESAVIERSPHRTELRRSKSDLVLLTNHALSPAFASDAENDRLKRYLTSGARYRRLDELTRKWRGVIDVRRALEILRDKRGGGGEPLGLGNRNALDALIATHSVVVDATNLLLWVSAGPHLLGRYIGFDLRHELLGEDHPAPPDLPADPVDSDELRAYGEALAHLRAAERFMKIAPDRAIEELQRASALQDRMPEPQRLLGDLLRRRGDLDGARRAYRRFLELDPPYLRDVEEVKGILGTL
jgi:tetratricopeptide (TPR) repeat protein